MQGSNSSRGTQPGDRYHDRRDHFGLLPLRSDGWAAKLTNPPTAMARRVLNLIDMGVLPGASEAQDAFSTLILNGDIDVFLDVFEAYNSQFKKIWDTGHDSTQPFQSTLTLKFPARWEPPNELAFLLALEKIRVDALKVAAHSDASEASVSACRCLAKLLAQGGVTELCLGTPLALPSEVVHAIQVGGVRSIELSHASGPTSDQDLKSYEALASSLNKCHSLEKLSLKLPPVLLATLGTCFEASGCPPLKSLNLHMGAAPVDVEGLKRVQWFMHVMATQCVTFEELAFGGTGFDADDMEEAIFKPMNGHKSLVHLDIFGGIGTVPKQVTLTVPLMVAALSASCPTLTHVKWRSGWGTLDAGAIMDAFKQLLDGDLNMPEVSAAMKQWLVNPACPLRSVEFEDIPLASGVMDAWFAAMAENMSIRELMLRGCCIPLPSTVVLMTSLQKNKTLHTLVLPADVGRYWLATRSGRIFGLTAPRAGPGVVVSPQAFTLRFTTNIDPQTVAEATSALDAVKDAGKAFFEARRTGFVENRRHMLTQGVVRDLEVFMANFMASALAANAPYAQQNLVGGFMPGAGIVLQHLEREQNLHTAARLSTLNKATHAYQESLPAEDFKRLEMDLEGRLKQDKEHNTVLSFAVLSGNVVALRQFLEAGEIDWGGHARTAAADSPEMLAVFDEFAPKMDNFIYAPTTTTTTTATTTSTTSATPATSTTTNTFAPNTTSEVTGLWPARGPTLTQTQASAYLLGTLPPADSDSDDETSLD